MMTLLDEPLLTVELDRMEFDPAPGSTYIYGDATEERSELDVAWRNKCVASGVTFVRVASQSRDDIEIEWQASLRGIALRSSSALRDLLESVPVPVYIDITSLSHSTWAPLLRACLQSGLPTFVVYAEPSSYTRSSHPTRGMLFDLSERIEDISPLPGFARLAAPVAGDRVRVVPLLGFEGARFGYLLEAVQEPPGSIIPIVGIPGFLPEHPFSTYAGNRNFLEPDHIHASVRLAKANCPFDAFHELYRIFVDHGRPYMKVAPIGTKPHGLGAVLFALSDPTRVELVYDHPVRAQKRTSGVGRVCVYDVGVFVQSDLFRRLGEYA